MSTGNMKTFNLSGLLDPQYIYDRLYLFFHTAVSGIVDIQLGPQPPEQVTYVLSDI